MKSSTSKLSNKWLVITSGCGYVTPCKTKDDVRRAVQYLKRRGYKRPLVYKR